MNAQALAISDEIRKGLLLLREPGLPDAERVLGVSRLVVATLRLVRKHLPGKHDQKAHGRHGSGPRFVGTLESHGVAFANRGASPWFAKQVHEALADFEPYLAAVRYSGGSHVNLERIEVAYHYDHNAGIVTGSYDNETGVLTLYESGVQDLADGILTGERIPIDRAIKSVVGHELGHALDLGRTAANVRISSVPSLKKALAKDNAFTNELYKTVDVFNKAVQDREARTKGQERSLAAALKVNLPYFASDPWEMSAQLLGVAMTMSTHPDTAWWKTNFPRGLRLAQRHLKQAVATADRAERDRRSADERQRREQSFFEQVGPPVVGATG